MYNNYVQDVLKSNKLSGRIPKYYLFLFSHFEELYNNNII